MPVSCELQRVETPSASEENLPTLSSIINRTRHIVVIMEGNYLLEPVLLPVLLDKKERKEEAGEELPEYVIKNILYISNILFDIFSTQSGKTFVIDRNDDLRICYDNYVVLMDKIVELQLKILKEEPVPWIDFSGKKPKVKRGSFSFVDNGSKELGISDMYRLFIILKYGSKEEKEKLEGGRSNIQGVFKKLYKNPNGYSILSFDVDSVTRAIYSMEEAGIIRIEKNIIINKDGERKFLYTIHIDKNVKKSLVKLIRKSIDEDVEKVVASFIDNPSLYCCKECNCGEIYTFDDLEGIEYECPRCNSRKLEIMTDDDKENAINCFVKGLPDILGEENKAKIRDSIVEKIFNPYDEEITIRIPSTVEPIADGDDGRMGIQEARGLLKYLVIKSFSIPPPKEIPSASPEPAPESVPDVISVPEVPVQVPSTSIVTPVEEMVPEPMTFHAEPIKLSPPGTVPYLPVKEVVSMEPRNLAMEMLRRWIIATKTAMDVLRQGSQRESRKKAFSMTKFYFFDSISKKYLFFALCGKYEDDLQREAYAKIDSALSILESDALFKINSFHPKFVERGIVKFLSLCKSGEVYLYDENARELEVAFEEFQDCKDPSKRHKKDEKEKVVDLFEKIIVDVKKNKVKDGKELMQLLLSKFDMKCSLDDKKVDLNFFKQE